MKEVWVEFDILFGDLVRFAMKLESCHDNEEGEDGSDLRRMMKKRSSSMSTSCGG